MEQNTQVIPVVVPDKKFGKLLLECMGCTETEKKDGFILKLQHHEVKEMLTPFGKKVVPIQQTFYMKVAEVCAVGFKAEMDIDAMKVVEREFDTEDNAGVIMLKWLHLN